ncbi:MAG: efflux RND transporter periplasmic adaptor subunit [Pseudomonadota bacterium]
MSNAANTNDALQRAEYVALSSEHEAKPDLPIVAVQRQPTGDSANPPVEHRWHPRSLALVALVLTSVAVGGIVGLYRQPPGLQWAMQTLGLEPGAGTSTPIAIPAPKPPAPSATQVAANTIIALGRLVPAGKVVTVAPASGVRDARISDLRVTEGDTVERGHILAVLDDEARLASAVASARSTVAVREAALDQSRASVRASLEESQATLAKAEAAALRARQSFERTERLYEKKIVSRASYDDRLAELREAEREVERQKATVSRYVGQDISSQPDVRLAMRNVDAAKAELQRIKQDFEQAYIRAPISGTVLQVNARAGEKPGEQGLLELGNVGQMTAELDVYQSQIGKVSIGDAVELSAVALPDKLDGSIRRIGLKVKRQSVIGQDPAANTDARVVEVIVGLDAPSSRRASRFTGLQVEARISTRGQP